jgi:hypothetical protein
MLCQLTYGSHMAAVHHVVHMYMAVVHLHTHMVHPIVHMVHPIVHMVHPIVHMVNNMVAAGKCARRSQYGKRDCCRGGHSSFHKRVPFDVCWNDLTPV